MAAFERGLVDEAVVREAMEECATSEWVDVEGFFSGRLSPAELESLRKELTPNEPVAVSARISVTEDGFSVAPRAPQAPSRAAQAPGEGDGPSTAPLDPDGKESARPDPPPTAAPPAPRGASRFVKLGALGTGGMGEVLEYDDAVLGRRIAVKLVRSDIAQREQAERLLDREARITGSLEHPNIIPVYDAGRDPDRGPFFMMRVLKEPPLNAVLRQLRTGDAEARQRHTFRRLMQTFVQVCRAVDYAHSRHIVHCDLKPANILLGPFGEVLVVDWGFAVRLDERDAHRGGTPGYMAPEQIDRARGAIDARTDVFALGAVLYEIVSLKKAFPPRAMQSLLGALRRGESVYPTPPRVRDRVATWTVPDALYDIAFRAFSPTPKDRYQTVGELANAVEAFLEGKAEEERKERRANELCEQGESLSETHADMLVSLSDQARETARLRAAVPPYAPSHEKQVVWDAEDRASVLTTLGVRVFQSAVTAFDGALEEVPSFPRARQGLARLYRRELVRAEGRGDEYDRVHFDALLGQVDDQATGAQPKPTAQVELVIDAHATVVLEHHAHVGRRLQTIREEPLMRQASLAPGTYTARVEIGDRVVRQPFVVRDDAPLSMVVPVLEAHLLDRDEVLIPAGTTLLGGHPMSPFGDAPIKVDVSTFAIRAYPVTFGEYLRYLATLSADDARAATPESTDGAPLFSPSGARAAIDRLVGPRVDALALPAFGLSARHARGFAAWLSACTGRTYRLPTDAEWEKAARGVDGRAYPWGDRFDPSFCKIRVSRPGRPAPEPCGAFDADESPFGVRDMAGGIAEYTAGDLGIGTRGGAWSDHGDTSHLAVRLTEDEDARSTRAGFRLLREL